MIEVRQIGQIIFRNDAVHIILIRIHAARHLILTEDLCVVMQEGGKYLLQGFRRDILLFTAIIAFHKQLREQAKPLEIPFKQAKLSDAKLVVQCGNNTTV